MELPAGHPDLMEARVLDFFYGAEKLPLARVTANFHPHDVEDANLWQTACMFQI